MRDSRSGTVGEINCRALTEQKGVRATFRAQYD